MPSFRRVVQALGDAWVNERAQVLEQADALVGAVQRELRLAEALQRGGRRGRLGRRPSLRLAGAPEVEPRPRGARRAGGRRPRGGLRPRVGRLRAGAEVPPAHPRRALPAARPPRRRRRGARPAHGAAHARRHGGRRHLRPPGRRVLPLLDRRPLARPPFREDAHRPGAAGPGLPARMAGRRAGRVSRRGHRDPGLRPAGPLDARGRALLVLRRRRRRRRGRARHLHRRRVAPDPPALPRRPGGRVVRDHAGRQLGGPLHSGPPRRGAAGAPARGGGGPSSCWPPRGRSGSSRPGTRRC